MPTFQTQAKGQDAVLHLGLLLCDGCGQITSLITGDTRSLSNEDGRQ